MEIILLEDIGGLGKRGSAVRVADGYARNFLIPRKKAIEAVGNARAVFKDRERARVALEAKQRQAAEGLRDELAKLSLQFSVEAGEEDGGGLPGGGGRIGGVDGVSVRPYGDRPPVGAGCGGGVRRQQDAPHAGVGRDREAYREGGPVRIRGMRFGDRVADSYDGGVGPVGENERGGAGGGETPGGGGGAGGQLGYERGDGRGWG